MPDPSKPYLGAVSAIADLLAGAMDKTFPTSPTLGGARPVPQWMNPTNEQRYFDPVGALSSIADFADIPKGAAKAGAPVLAMLVEKAAARAAEEKAAKAAAEGSKAVLKKIRAFHGTSTPGLKRVNVSKAVETPGAVFFATNKDVAHTFTVPREYGEPMFYDESGRKIRPGRVIQADLAPKNPYTLPAEQAQKFIDDTIFQTEVVKHARLRGHDAVIAKDVKEGIGERYPGDIIAILNDAAISYPGTKKR